MANEWISVTERMPDCGDYPTLIWGDRLQPDDFPLYARLDYARQDTDPKGGVWLLLDMPEEEDAAAHTHRMCGNVTHWLDWTPPGHPKKGA